MSARECDLLLLNFSNYPDFPLFPYAFTQVSAVARREGLAVARADFLHVPTARWRSELQRLIATHRPRVVGITIRQNDSLMLDSYRTTQRPPFFPLESTRLAIRCLRELTTAPILVGGIGFSIHPDRIFRYIEPDYGCVGCADDVLAHFEAIARRVPGDGVANLIRREGDRLVVPPRTFFDPLAEPEWDDPLVDDLFDFYDAAHLASDASAVPVEVMRGCPFRCYFCAEPVVKGRKWRTRDLAVVRAELDFFIARKLRYFWFIASELNIDGPDFVLELAEMMIRVREDHADENLIWSGYMLPWKTNEKDFAVLRRSGYRLGWNDFQSFSNDNLKKTRVPYRMKDVRPFIEASFDPSFLAPSSTPGAKANPMLVLFLGNAFADATTISETLRYADEIELQRTSAQDAMLIPAVRLFEFNQPLTNSTPANTAVFAPQGAAPEALLHPTFQVPQALLDALGSHQAYREFLNFVGETFLSRAHLVRKDWNRFLAAESSIRKFSTFLKHVSLADLVIDLPGSLGEDVRALVTELAAQERRSFILGRLFAPPPLNVSEYRQLARILIEAIEAAHLPERERVRRALGLRRSPESEYQLMDHLYRRYDSVPALVADVRTKLHASEIEMFLLAKYLFRNNVVIDPRYRALLFGPSARRPKRRAHV